MMLDFVNDPANATFGGRGEMRDNTIIISGWKSREEGEKCNGIGICKSLLQPCCGSRLLW